MDRIKIESTLPGTLSEEGVAELELELELAPPSMYEVILHNDDYTPMDFVVLVLEKFFNLDHGAANVVMYQVHTLGKGVCGVFTRDVAETKVSQVTEFARENNHPLLCTMEKLED